MVLSDPSPLVTSTIPATCVDVAKWTADGFTETCVLMSREQTIGLAFTVEANVITLCSIVLLFGLIVRNILHEKRSNEDGRWKLLERPIDIYMLSLFAFDFLQALAGVLDMKWVNEGMTYTDGYCTAQGVIGQLGEGGSATMTIIISLHTLFKLRLWLEKANGSRKVAHGLISAVWLFFILWVIIGAAAHRNPNDLYMTPTPYWCWVGSRYLGERIAGEYIWLWLALVTSLVTYIPLFFWRFVQNSDLDRQQRVSFIFLAYPLVYSFIIIPVSVIRWMTFVDTTFVVPEGATFFAQVLFGLTGLFNVLLLRYFRPGVLLFTQRKDESGRAPTAATLSKLPSHLGSRTSLFLDDGYNTMSRGGVEAGLDGWAVDEERDDHVGVNMPSPPPHAYDRYDGNFQVTSRNELLGLAPRRRAVPDGHEQ